MLKDGVIRCDMRTDCDAHVTHLDHKGYVYCSEHAVIRRRGGHRVRALRPYESRKLERGETIARY